MHITLTQDEIAALQPGDHIRCASTSYNNVYIVYRILAIHESNTSDNAILQLMLIEDVHNTSNTSNSIHSRYKHDLYSATWSIALAADSAGTMHPIVRLQKLLGDLR